MTNRIREVVIQDVRLDPIEAEVRVIVHLEQPAPADAVRGRLVGPRCALASTLEVSHPFLPDRTGSAAADERTRSYRVVIPEPSFWDTERPFLYEALVELREAARVPPVSLWHGLRTFVLGPHGLRWNGQPTTLRGIPRDRLTADDAAALRQAGYNTLLAPCLTPTIWEAADRWGFLVLGRISTPAELTDAAHVQRHACALGFLLAPAVWRASPDTFAGLPGLVGIEVDDVVPERLPPGVDFAWESGNKFNLDQAPPLHCRSRPEPGRP